MTDSPIGAYRPDDDEMPPCDRCGKAERVLVFWRLNARGAKRYLVELCAECLAEALDIATGYPVSKQLARWTEFSAHASELQRESTRSRKAFKKQQERNAARAKLQAKGF